MDSTTATAGCTKEDEEVEDDAAADEDTEAALVPALVLVTKVVGATDGVAVVGDTTRAEDDAELLATTSATAATEDADGVEATTEVNVIEVVVVGTLEV